jgi:uncharacterized protein (DUF302 family)
MQDKNTNENSLSVNLKLDFDSAIVRATDALKVEGFGLLTEIDVKATLKKKLDIDFQPYRILGACNPALAHRALTIAPQIGLLLPCNVIVQQHDDGSSQVTLVDPLLMLGVIDHPDLKLVAEEARIRLERVADALRDGK